MSNVKSQFPSLRFDGFAGNWQETSFGQITQISSASRVHKHEWKKSGVPFFRTSDVVAHFKSAENEKAYISYELYTSLSRKSGRVKKGDLLVTGGGSVGIPYLITSNTPLYFKDADLLWIKNKNNSGYFLYTYFMSPMFRGYLDGISHIGTISHYTISQANSTPITIPTTLDEQTKIGDFFQNLDQQIKLHQDKHNKLQQLKQAMLGKMFPKFGAKVPQVRFDGFNSDWEIKEFQSVFVNIRNNSLSRAELNDNTGIGMNVHYGDVLVKFGEILDFTLEKVPFITNGGAVEKMMPNRLQDGDVVIADAAEDITVGKCCEVNNLGDQLLFAGLHTIAVRPKKAFAPKYLGYFLNSNLYHDQLLTLIQGTKVSSISKSSIAETLIYYPKDTEEQAKIGEYFHKFDRLISLQQQKINKLKNIKQACLGKMFV
ncbi:restriction endonuclease subunit S [Vibrio cholerae]